MTPVRRIAPDWIDEDPLDELTQSDRALLSHLYGTDIELDAVESISRAQLATEVGRERQRGAVSGGRPLTAEDLRRIIGRLTLSAQPVPVEVQARLMNRLAAQDGVGRLDVVL